MLMKALLLWSIMPNSFAVWKESYESTVALPTLSQVLLVL